MGTTLSGYSRVGALVNMVLHSVTRLDKKTIIRCDNSGEDEPLVVSWMEDESTTAEFGAGELLFFKRGTVHAQPKILEEPVIFLAIDTPRRDPKDIVFVNPEDGTPESFIRANP